MSVTNASQWHSHLSAAAIPDERRQWLMNAPRLVQAFKANLGEVVMEKLQETYAEPLADEKGALNLKDEKARLRQVIIATHSGHSLCYARVIIPDKTYEAYAQSFSSLGSQFIGDSLLYNNKEVIRKDFEFACFDSTSSYASAFFELKPDAKIEESLWAARRSIFLWQDNPLLITEFLLPYLVQVPYTSREN
ncbi:MAG: chorismate lyase [Gammaproteobacteria bacterium]|nr:chorismate lyase [Gammaproteobacteria bacterium]